MLILSLFCDHLSAVRKNWDESSLFGLFRHEYRGYAVENHRFPGSPNALSWKLRFQQYNRDLRAGTIQTVYVYPLNKKYQTDMKNAW